MKGRITKGVGGLYTVHDGENFYDCKARGVFRKNGITPLVGDIVSFESDSANKYVITQIAERKNKLIRPAVANIDTLFIVVSSIDPSPNTFIIDKTIAIAEFKNIEPVLIITKTDLADFSDIIDVYKNSGIRIIVTNIDNEDGIYGWKGVELYRKFGCRKVHVAQ